MTQMDIILSTEQFFQKFEQFREIFEQEETVYDDNENGIWIHAILPNSTSSTNALYIQAWDFATTDPICFVYYKNDKILIGTAECYYAEDPAKLKQLLKI